MQDARPSGRLTHGEPGFEWLDMEVEQLIITINALKVSSLVVMFVLMAVLAVWSIGRQSKHTAFKGQPYIHFVVVLSNMQAVFMDACAPRRLQAPCLNCLV